MFRAIAALIVRTVCTRSLPRMSDRAAVRYKKCQSQSVRHKTAYEGEDSNAVDDIRHPPRVVVAQGSE
jgi:hypothetical protein